MGQAWRIRCGRMQVAGQALVLALWQAAVAGQALAHTLWQDAGCWAGPGACAVAGPGACAVAGCGLLGRPWLVLWQALAHTLWQVCLQPQRARPHAHTNTVACARSPMLLGRRSRARLPGSGTLPAMDIGNTPLALSSSLLLLPVSCGRGHGSCVWVCGPVRSAAQCRCVGAARSTRLCA